MNNILQKVKQAINYGISAYRKDCIAKLDNRL